MENNMVSSIVNRETHDERTKKRLMQYMTRLQEAVGTKKEKTQQGGTR